MKLSSWVIIFVGLCIGLSAAGFAYFNKYAPDMLDAENYNKKADELEAEANKMNLAKKRVKEAQKIVDDTTVKWREIATLKTPPATLAGGGIDLSVNPWQLVVDSRKYRNALQTEVNTQVRKGGVKVINGPSIPFPDESAPTIVGSYFNYPAIPFPVVIFDLGTVTIQGTYQQITNHIRSWSSMPRYLAVADGLQITGTSPLLTATYNLSLVGYQRSKSVFGAVPEIASGGGGANPAGGAGGGGGRGEGRGPARGGG